MCVRAYVHFHCLRLHACLTLFSTLPGSCVFSLVSLHPAPALASLLSVRACVCVSALCTYSHVSSLCMFIHGSALCSLRVLLCLCSLRLRRACARIWPRECAHVYSWCGTPKRVFGRDWKNDIFIMSFSSFFFGKDAIGFRF